jgi:Ribonuclease G/E
MDVNEMMEWALIPRMGSLLSGAEIDRLLVQGKENVKALREQMRHMRPSWRTMQIRLR